jgi:opacity protein-like surface antigen
MKRNHRLVMLVIAIAVAVMLVPSVGAMQPFRFGATAGMSIANQTIDYNDQSDIPGVSIDFNYRAGLAFGLMAEYPVSQYVTVRPQVQYVQKGFKDNIILTTPQGPVGNGTDTYKQRIDYLSIPVLAKVVPPLNSFVVPYALAGPRLDFKVNDKSDFFTDEQLSNGAKSTVFGLSLGAGVQKTLPSGGTLLVEGLWDWDLTNSMEMTTLDSKNKSFLIQVGYLLK